MPCRVRRARRSASLRPSPRRSPARISISRWNDSSSSKSASARRRLRRGCSLAGSASSHRLRCTLHLLQANDAADGRGQPPPLFGLLFELPTARSGERIKLGAATEFARLPLGPDPALLLELVQRRVQRSIAHPQLVAGDLAQSLTDRPAVERFERQNLEEQQVEGAL